MKKDISVSDILLTIGGALIGIVLLRGVGLAFTILIELLLACSLIIVLAFPVYAATHLFPLRNVWQRAVALFVWAFVVFSVMALPSELGSFSTVWNIAKLAAIATIVGTIATYLAPECIKRIFYFSTFRRMIREAHSLPVRDLSPLGQNSGS